MKKIKSCKLKKRILSSEQDGMTLMELVVALGISAILVTVIVVFCSNMVLQYKQQKQTIDSSSKTTYLLQVFNTIDEGSSVRVRADNKALEVSDNSSTPAVKSVYYELNNSIYQDSYEDSKYKKTIALAKNYSINFSLESNSSYLKDILQIVISDSSGTSWERKISLRDCDTVETY
ncbi:MAG: type II secretion system protein [Deltaproteobacteria bacterium]